MRSLLKASWIAGCLALAVGGLAAQEPGKKGAEPVPPPKGLVAADPCGPVCCGTTKVCVPVCDVKKKTTVVYGCKCVDFCLPKCSFGGGLFGRCNDSCATGDCEHPRTKRVLLKKVVTEECPSYKCEVEERPCGSCAGNGLLSRFHGGHSVGHAEVILPREPVPAAAEPAAKPLPR